MVATAFTTAFGKIEDLLTFMTLIHYGEGKEDEEVEVTVTEVSSTLVITTHLPPSFTHALSRYS